MLQLSTAQTCTGLLYCTCWRLYHAAEQWSTCLQRYGHGSLKAECAGCYRGALFSDGWERVIGGSSTRREGRSVEQRGSPTWLWALRVRVRLEQRARISLAARVKAWWQRDVGIRIWHELFSWEGEGPNIWHPAGPRVGARTGERKAWTVVGGMAVGGVWHWQRRTEQVVISGGVYLVVAAAVG